MTKPKAERYSKSSATREIPVATGIPVSTGIWRVAGKFARREVATQPGNGHKKAGPVNDRPCFLKSEA